MSILKRKADSDQQPKVIGKKTTRRAKIDIVPPPSLSFRLIDHVQADEIASLKTLLSTEFKDRLSVDRGDWYRVPDDSSLASSDSDESDGESNDDTENDESKVAADLANFVDEILEELLRYLYLLGHYKCDCKSVKLSPSDIIDEAFHILLLNPVLYHKVCDFILNLLGHTAVDRPIRVLPHNLDGSDDQEAREKRLQVTYDFYLDVFKHDPPEHIWVTDDPPEPIQETPAGEPMFHITVKIMDNKPILISVGSVSETVVNLKRRIQAKEGIAPDQQRLKFKGRSLDDSTLLSSHDITHGSTVDLSVRRLGC